MTKDVNIDTTENLYTASVHCLQGIRKTQILTVLENLPHTICMYIRTVHIYTVYMISYNMLVSVNKSNFCNLNLPCIPTVQSYKQWLNTSTANTLEQYPEILMVT